MVDGQYKFIIYSCTIYIEKASGIVVNVYMWCNVVHEFESCATYNVSCLFYFSLSSWGPRNFFKLNFSLLFTLMHAVLLRFDFRVYL